MNTAERHNHGMPKQPKELVAVVKPYKLEGKQGYGITAGPNKWHSSLYPTFVQAQALVDVLNARPDVQLAIETNVAYTAPFMWAGEAKRRKA